MHPSANHRYLPCCLVLLLGPFSACGQVDDEHPDLGQTLADASAPPAPEAGTCADCGAPDAGLAPPTTRDSGGDANSGVDAFVPVMPTDASLQDAGSAQDAQIPIPTVDSGITLPTYPNAEFPAQILDLTHWKLNVPFDTEHAGNPDEYRNPELQTFALPPYFTVTPRKDGVAFRAHAAGATTPNSRYPRSELREMMGSEHAAWSTTSGTHRMRVTQAITHVMPVKPEVVSAQIHDARDDVVMVRLEENHLFVEGNGDEFGTLDDNYQLGTIFTVEIVAQNGTIEVFYNGESKALIQRAVDGCYFKAGCYAQSNVDRGDKPDAFAEVIIYDLVVTHE